MTSAPSDLMAFRSSVFRECGFTDPNDVGIIGDRAHEANGGYHVGKSGLQRIGRYTGSWADNVGSSTQDYSARLARDRQGLTEDASAMDIGDDWPRGGRAAWLRWNALMVGDLRAGNMPAIRAINYTLRGTRDDRRRIDRQNGFRDESSGDNVEIHTHIEWYRDTAGLRSGTLNRILQLIRQAITGTTGGGTMAGEIADKALAQLDGRNALGDVYLRLSGVEKANGYSLVEAHAKLNALGSMLTSMQAAIAVLTDTVNHLATGGGSIEVQAIMDLINTRADQEKAREDERDARLRAAYEDAPSLPYHTDSAQQ